MNAKQRSIAILVLVMSLAISGCGSKQLFVPTVTSTLTPKPSIGSTKVSSMDGMVQVFVPAGEFLMGATDAEIEVAIQQNIQSNKDGGYDFPPPQLSDYDNRPQHTVYLDAFWIDQTEVTQGMYAKCEGCAKPSCSNPTYGGGDNYPVICVDWLEAAAYCGSVGRRLPTEAEWEKAARGTDGRIYPWGNALPDCDHANGIKTDNKTHCVENTIPVGSYSAGVSPYGALDMAGNVREWVNDWYDNNYYNTSPANNPLGPTKGTNKVLRGGGFDDYFYNQWVMGRNSSPLIDPDWIGYVGFRCAASEGK